MESELSNRPSLGPEASSNNSMTQNINSNNASCTVIGSAGTAAAAAASANASSSEDKTKDELRKNPGTVIVPCRGKCVWFGFWSCLVFFCFFESVLFSLFKDSVNQFDYIIINRFSILPSYFWNLWF